MRTSVLTFAKYRTIHKPNSMLDVIPCKLLIRKFWWDQSREHASAQHSRELGAGVIVSARKFRSKCRILLWMTNCLSWSQRSHHGRIYHGRTFQCADQRSSMESLFPFCSKVRNLIYCILWRWRDVLPEMSLEHKVPLDYQRFVTVMLCSSGIKTPGGKECCCARLR